MKTLIQSLVTSLLLVTANAAFAANPIVVVTTNHGEMQIELAQDKAPKTVENFLSYVKDGHYDGTVFHRVISNFMIQGGGFSADMQQKPTKAPIINEADNGLANKRGTIAMARTGAPHSATAQFFINVVDNNPLNYSGKNSRGWGYAVFGKVIKGMDVADKIRAVPTGAAGPFRRDAPVTPVVIESIKLLAE